MTTSLDTPGANTSAGSEASIFTPTHTHTVTRGRRSKNDQEGATGMSDGGSKFVRKVQGQLNRVDYRVSLIRDRMLAGQRRTVTRRLAQMLLKLNRMPPFASDPITSMRMSGREGLRLTRADGRVIGHLIAEDRIGMAPAHEWFEIQALLPRLGLEEVYFTADYAASLCRRRRRNRVAA